MWEQLLSTTGFKLEIPKCAVYTMKWKFDEQGIPYLDNNYKATIHISSSETKTKQTIPHLSNHVLSNTQESVQLRMVTRTSNSRSHLTLYKRWQEFYPRLTFIILNLSYTPMHVLIKSYITLSPVYHFLPNNIRKSTMHIPHKSYPPWDIIERGAYSTLIGLS